MHDLDFVPRLRFADPVGHLGLESFSCGDAEPYEVEVNQIVQDLYRGRSPDVSLLIAEHPGNGDLVGACGIAPRSMHPAPPDQPDPDEAYLYVIGLNEPFRGGRLPDRSRLGTWLLDRALSEIQERWGGGPMPPVWALVHPENVPSQAMFEHHKFGFIRGQGHWIAYRNRDVPHDSRNLPS